MEDSKSNFDGGDRAFKGEIPSIISHQGKHRFLPMLYEQCRLMNGIW